jgi:hypothetical protein
MTLYEFNRLKEKDQFTFLWRHGVFLINITTGPKKYALYQIDTFYVEVRYDFSDNKIEGLRSFLNASQLDMYLSHIKIPLRA